MFINLINKFGWNGGFGTILKRIQNKANTCPIEIVASIVEAIGNISELMCKSFAEEFIP